MKRIIDIQDHKPAVSYKSVVHSIDPLPVSLDQAVGTVGFSEKKQDPPTAKKNQLSPDQILKIIQKFKKGAKNYDFWKKKYERISKKYDGDLEDFLKREGDNLPEDDWGKRVLYYYKKTKRASGKLAFYERLLTQCTKSGENKTKTQDTNL